MQYGRGWIILKKLVPLLLVVILCVATAAGCSAGNDISGMDTAEAQEDMLAADGVGIQTQEDSAADDSAEKDSAVQSQLQRTDSRKVIKRADLMIQTTQYDESIRNFELLVASFGGYIENSFIDGDTPGSDELRSARYTVRVPADQLEEFLTGAGDVGTVISKSINGEDITQTYFDAETRLKTLRTEQERILELMEKAQKIEDIIAIEQRLTEVQNEIEQITGQLKQWDSLVSLSTVTVSINEVRDIVSTKADGLGGQIASVFHASLHTLTEVCRYLVLAVTAASPFLAFAAVIGAVVVYLRKIIRKRKKQKINPEQQDNSTPNTK
jgi:hypothetical protein